MAEVEEEREIRKQRALSEGFPVKFLACPLCGMNKLFKKYESGEYEFTNIDFSRMFIIQVRRGGGRGSGFFLDKDSSLLLEEVKADSDYHDVLRQIKEQCKRILAEIGDV